MSSCVTRAPTFAEQLERVFGCHADTFPPIGIQDPGELAPLDVPIIVRATGEVVRNPRPVGGCSCGG